MEMTIQNLPFVYLLWITIGVLFIVIGVFMIVAHENEVGHYTSIPNKESETTEDLEGILSYFLEEEEKKNQGFRDMLETYAKEMGGKGHKTVKENHTHEANKVNHINEITALADEGLEIEEIARRLGKGVGEVQLILSLYKMR